MQPSNVSPYKMCRVCNGDFILHVQLIRETLKTRNKGLLYEFDQLFSTLIDPDYFIEVLSLAIKQLAEADSEAYRWFLQSYDRDVNQPESRMVETRPVETRSVETRSVETHPVEIRLVEGAT